MTVSDYIINFLEKKGVDTVFFVSGGGIMYLTDALLRNKKVKYVANHHEQASATCAESYARLKNSPGACLVTTGPGSTNAITGVAGAWLDSVPMIVISGQVRTSLIADYRKLRQLGPQEINIIPMVKPITKYAVTVMKADRIRYEMEKAWYEATTGRPGPVWLNIPLDIQSAEIDEHKLSSFIPPKPDTKAKIYLEKMIKQTLELLGRGEHPLLVLGYGIRIAGGIKEMEKMINTLHLPFVTFINGLDLMPHSHPYHLGTIGPGGNRAANLALQNADLILSIGASLHVSATGFNFKDFAPKAKIIMVNIDPAEIRKKNLHIDLPVIADAKDFLLSFTKEVRKNFLHIDSGWHKAVNYWKVAYPRLPSTLRQETEHVNSYRFMAILGRLLTGKDRVITGIGLDCVSLYQSFSVKKGQRAYVNQNLGQMGWCLPAATGACFASGKHRTILVTGDGSLQFNLQELAVIAHHKLPIKLFVFANKGYHSIRNTQNNLFSGRLIGADIGSGLSFPDLKRLSFAYRIPYGYIRNDRELEAKIRKALSLNGPALFEVNIAYNQERIPRSITTKDSSGKLISPSLSDMYPFLSEKEKAYNKKLLE